MASQRDSLVVKYFYEGYNYQTILHFLINVHGISLSLRTLKRILQRKQLKRRRKIDAGHVGQIEDIIKKELLGSGKLLGYRGMWRRIRLKYKQPVARRTVMCLLAYLDPEGSLERQRRRLQRRMYRSKGPNDVWHCDGYDKLKPYGFAIHGCIDGYSRRIMWLEVGPSNCDPKVIADFYLKAVSSINGTPCLLRCDLGSENSIIAYAQPFLRRNNSDSRAGLGSFRYGKSVFNQRIESLWSQVGKQCTYWWLNFFRGMAYNDLFISVNQIHQDCLKFCFSHLIQKDLYQFIREWNCHRIRHNTAAHAVNGHPNELYFMPQLQGAENKKCPVDAMDIQFVENRCTPLPQPPVDICFLIIATDYMVENNIHMPMNIREAILLYVELVDMLESL